MKLRLVHAPSLRHSIDPKEAQKIKKEESLKKFRALASIVCANNTALNVIHAKH